MGKEARGRARPGRPRASARFYAAGPGRTNPSRRVARSLGRACVSSPRSPWLLKPRAGHCQPRDQLEARAGAAGSMRAAAPQRWRQGKGLRLDHPCRAGRTLLAAQSSPGRRHPPAASEWKASAPATGSCQPPGLGPSCATTPCSVFPGCDPLALGRDWTSFRQRSLFSLNFHWMPGEN